MPVGHTPAHVRPVTTLRARGRRSQALSSILKVQNALKNHKAFHSLYDGKIQVKKNSKLIGKQSCSEQGCLWPLFICLV